MVPATTMPRDTELWERCCHIGTAVGKAENMRVTASTMTVELVDNYLKTDQGVMDCFREGVEANVKGVFELVVQTPGYPADVFGSFRSFETLLQIGRAEDPVEADKQHRAKREEQRANPKPKPVTQTTASGGLGNNEPEPAIYEDVTAEETEMLRAAFKAEEDVTLADAEPDVKAWIATFASWPIKKRKRVYGLFLKLTATGEILK